MLPTTTLLRIRLSLRSLSSSLLSFALFFAALSTTSIGCANGSRPELDVGIDEGTREILVLFGRDLKGEETLHARLRRGTVDDLDCAGEAPRIERIDGRPVRAKRPTWRGPKTEPSMFESTYDNSWLEGEPTEEMLEEARQGDWIIDVCLMKEGEVVRERAFDIRRALDNPGGDGKFDGGEEERIRSTVAYAERCVADLGEIPFFEQLEDGDYATYNCLDSVPIPTTVTRSDGTVGHPSEQVDQCDNPQYIYNLCEPNAVDGRTNGPRVASRSNEKGTHWVLLCRKAKEQEGSYNDIAMIGHNPYTGDTCFFQNALYRKTDGLHVPHPGDTVDSGDSPQQSASLWDGIHGGLGSGIECAECHSNDAFIHTPWIDGARDERGEPVVPKMGVDDDFVLGYNEAPYSIINAQGQGWTMPKHLVSPEASACTRCHRIPANDRWMNDWIDRLVGEDEGWNSITTPAYRDFEHAFWMPPDVDGLDEESWDESEFGRAVKFIQGCADDPTGCIYADLPDRPISDDGDLPEIEIEGAALATGALKVLGADFDDPSCPGGDCATRRCAECHSVSRAGLRHWRDLTDFARTECNLGKDPRKMNQKQAQKAVDCLRVDPDDPSSVFAAANLGVYTTGVQYTRFRRLFQKAYGGGDAWLIPYGRFKARVGMPKGSHPKLSQKEYATVLKWFEEGLPNLNEVLREQGPPTTCSESYDTQALTAHIDDMKFEGWGAANEESGLRMFGCAPGADPTTCFTSGFADRTAAWGNNLGTVRELTELGFRTSFWTRSSADGRFVGNGGGSSSGATITDLQTGRDIAVKASYDPGFFPDNSGFIFQGSVGGAGLCDQSVLESDDSIDFTETGCTTASGINLYQHVARGVNGGDYFVINSQFTSDSGQASQDPSAHFNASSTMKFTPMVFNGTTYEAMDPVIVDSPYEGDSVLSPSSELVASRLAGPDGAPLGYVVRKVNATPLSSGYAIDIDQEVATICTSGAKPSFSFDERFIVTHTYRNGRADILLFDLLTGDQFQVTDMPQGTYAMFPHFRSDGWFYFLVADGSDRYIAASDAAVRIAGP